jgi:hypothetical protein
MALENKNIVGKLHCPECSCMLIVIDNEIAFCPRCLISSENNGLSLKEEESQKRISSITNLKFNKSTYC